MLNNFKRPLAADTALWGSPRGEMEFSPWVASAGFPCAAKSNREKLGRRATEFSIRDILDYGVRAQYIVLIIINLLKSLIAMKQTMKQSILVVEDEEHIRDMVKLTLTLEKY